MGELKKEIIVLPNIRIVLEKSDTKFFSLLILCTDSFVNNKMLVSNQYLELELYLKENSDKSQIIRIPITIMYHDKWKNGNYNKLKLRTFTYEDEFVKGNVNIKPFAYKCPWWSIPKHKLERREMKKKQAMLNNFNANNLCGLSIAKSPIELRSQNMHFVSGGKVSPK
ncbi:MAG: hypothetical protein RSE04_02275 [Hydrogenoanaerobacterium sp.]